MKALRDVRVLVIDDYRWMTRTVRGLLAQVGVRHVSESHDGTQALTLLETGGFDLAICNHVLNYPDGMDVLRRVRSIPSTSHVPFVFYSLDRSPETLSAMLRAGADGCLNKPIRVEAMRDMVERVLAGRRTTAGASPGAAAASTLP